MAGACAVLCAGMAAILFWDDQKDLAKTFLIFSGIGAALAFKIHLAIFWALSAQDFWADWNLIFGELPHGLKVTIQIQTWTILPGQPPGVGDAAYLTAILLVPAGCMLLAQSLNNKLARVGAMFAAFSPAFSAYIMVLLNPSMAGMEWISQLGIFEFIVKPLAGLMVFLGYFLLILPVLLASTGVAMVMKEINIS